ncbi:MAG: hypothetical protein GTO08_08910 [Deltaproteobacteria bacterium]|nr:hypothetical protein [Deltaproteobacteria bacterium]
MITVKGILTVLDWDDAGNALGLVLSSFHEEEYVIDTSSLSSLDLTELIREAVEITGTLVEERKGRKVIRLQEIKRITDQ